MAPKQRNLAAMLGVGSGATAATPESKSAKSDVTPDEPKRRKLNEGSAVPVAEKPVVDSSVSVDVGPISLWSGPVGPDPKSLSSPGYDPASRSSEFTAGKPLGFALLSGALQIIEGSKGQGSRKAKTLVLTNVFRTILHFNPVDLVPAIYIITNKVAPDYELDSELGIGDSTLIRSMCEVFGRNEKDIKASMNSGECQDLGQVALVSRLSQKMLMMPPKLTIAKVFGEMKAIAHTAGKDSQKDKKDRIKKMLVASRDEEAKFIVRMLQAKLRVGLQTPTLLQAVAYAFVLTKPGKNGKGMEGDIRKSNAPPSLAEIDARLTSMEAAIKQAFCEMPNFEMITKALFDGHDGSSLATACHISIGLPVKPMLAKPSKGLKEVGDRMEGKRFTGEWKYDGERAQIHVVNRDTILIYSRNSENMTQKYPDVVAFVKETLTDKVESCIIDSELVAFDQVKKEILPFQVLSTRGKKNVKVEDVKINVCIFAFDMMLFNGVALVKEDLESRRAKLWSSLREEEGKVKFAIYKDFDELKEDEVQAFLDESVAGKCEGLMLKTLNENATYQPSKRSLNWLKLKKDYMDGAIGDSIDVVPIGAFYGKGKRTGTYGAYLLAIYDPDSEEYQTVCKAGTGFSDEDLVTHHAFFQSRKLEKASASYNTHANMTPDVWLDASQVWEIKAADLSVSPVHTSAIDLRSDGKGIGLRFPRFIRIREDKSPEEATSAEQILEMFHSQSCVADGGDDE